MVPEKDIQTRLVLCSECLAVSLAVLISVGVGISEFHTVGTIAKPVLEAQHKFTLAVDEETLNVVFEPLPFCTVDTDHRSILFGGFKLNKMRCTRAHRT